MSKIIKFEIVTPERVVLKEDILQLSVPTKSGEITVLHNHIPLVSSLNPGVLDIVKVNGEKEVMAISGGFIEVLKDKVVVLADTAEMASEIDMARVEEGRKRAKEIKENTRHFDQERFASISAKIAKELARSSAVKRWKRIKGD